MDVTLDIDALRKAFDVSEAKLRSVAYLERQVRRFGIRKKRPEECDPDVPGDREFDFSMEQNSTQFAKYLIYLSHHNIRSYLELGIWTGGAFTFATHYLRRMTGLERAVAIDIELPCKAFGEVLAANSWMSFYQCDSLKPEFAKLLETLGAVDYAFIDAEHKKAPVLSDFNNLKRYAGMLGFHDICQYHCREMPDAWRTIREACAENKIVEFLDQDQAALKLERTLQGIGVIHLGACDA